MKPYSKCTKEELEEMLNSDAIGKRQKFRIKAFLNNCTTKPKADPYEYSTGKWV